VHVRRSLIGTMLVVTPLGGAFAVSAQAADTSAAVSGCPVVTAQPQYGEYGVNCVVGNEANGLFAGVNASDGSGLQVGADALYCTTTSTGKQLCAGGAQWVEPLRADGGTLVCYGLSCAFVKP
jgi:hypothetical protein